MTRTTNWWRTGTSPPDPPDAAPAFRPPGLRAGEAALLARVAGRLDALDDRVRRGPEGWRQRLALIAAADLGWFAGDRIAPDRLALWQSLRLSGAQGRCGRAGAPRLGGAAARERAGAGGGSRISWVAMTRRRPGRRPTALPSGRAAGSSSSRRRERCTRSRAPAWTFTSGGSRVSTGMATGLSGGAVFAPLAMGGAGGCARSGRHRSLAGWLAGMERACLAAMRHLDDIEAWAAQAEGVMAPHAGRTSRALRSVLTAWPLVAAPMAEALNGASRAAAQRNLAWMEAHGLIREVIGQGRFRMWRAAS